MPCPPSRRPIESACDTARHESTPCRDRTLSAPIAKGLRRRVYIGLALAIGLDTIGQLLWKQAASGLPTSLSPSALLASVVHDPLPIVVVGVFVLQLVNWLAVLRRADLSFAQPITSLSYVSVVLLSAGLLGERIDAARMWGLSLILIGVALIGADTMRGERST